MSRRVLVDAAEMVQYFMTAVSYDKTHKRWFIRATNSDGAGGYEVIWVFEQGGYKKRFVYYGF